MSDHPITITLEGLVFETCPHCQATTVQALPKPAVPEGADPLFTNQHCLQCIADGGTCCSLSDLTRYA